jgi:hypothetical protein
MGGKAPPPCEKDASMQGNQYIENQLAKLKTLQEGKARALDAQAAKCARTSRVFRTAMLGARISAATGCALPVVLFLLGASNAGIGVTATIVSFLFVAALGVCGVFGLLSRLYEKKRSELANACKETLDMIAVMESLMKAPGGEQAEAAGPSREPLRLAQ